MAYLRKKLEYGMTHGLTAEPEDSYASLEYLMISTEELLHFLKF
jgi:hypothetical protein